MDENQMVSVIIPTYNRADYIGKAIQSVLDQTWQNFEIIVVDDGSEDNTRQVVEGVGDSRIRYICLDQNGGASHARNEGIRLAESEFIAFLDSDDEWMPEKLEKQMKAMFQSSDKVGLIFCRMRENSESGNPVIIPSLRLKKEQLEGNIFNNLVCGNVIGAPTVLARRNCLKQIGGFDEELHCLEDWDLVLRIAENWEIGFVDDILVEVHHSEGSVSSNIRAWVDTRCYMIAKYWKIMAQGGVLEALVEDLMMRANEVGYYEEARQMLSAAFRL